MDIREAFRQGLFLMNSSLPASSTAPGVQWNELLVNQIMIGIAAVVLLVTIGRIYQGASLALKACFSSKACLEINEKVKTKKSRNIAYASLILPFILVISWLDFPQSRFISGFDIEWRSLVYLGVFVAYMLLRKLLNLFFSLGKGDERRAMRESNLALYNIFIISALILIIAIPAMILSGVDAEIVRKVVLYVIAAAFILFFDIDFQIFRQFIKGFRSFLYLCALEIIPLVIIVLWIR